jgi:hypothetical protein
MTKPDDGDDVRKSASKAMSIHMKAMNGDGLTDKDAEEYTGLRAFCIYSDIKQTFDGIPPSSDSPTRIMMAVGAYIAKQELAQLKPIAKQAEYMKKAASKRIITAS